MVHGDNLLEILLPGDSPPHLVIYGQVVLVPFYKKIPSLVGPLWSGVHVKLWLQV